MTARVSMQLKSRVSPDMLPFSLCNKKRLAIRHMNRPLFPTISIPSYDIGKQVGLRTYQHPLVQAYIRTFIHTHTLHTTYIHTHIHNTHTHTYIHTYTHTYIHAYIHTCIHTHTHTYIHTYIHNIYIYTYIHTYIHTYIRTQINTYAYTSCVSYHFSSITLHYVTIHRTINLIITQNLVMNSRKKSTGSSGEQRPPGCVEQGRQDAVTTKCTVTCNICGFSGLKLFLVISPAPRIMRRLLEF